MLKHLLRWHPDTEIALNKKQDCNQCDRKFFFKSTLVKHLKVDHGTVVQRLDVLAARLEETEKEAKRRSSKVKEILILRNCV